MYLQALAKDFNMCLGRVCRSTHLEMNWESNCYQVNLFCPVLVRFCTAHDMDKRARLGAKHSACLQVLALPLLPLQKRSKCSSPNHEDHDPDSSQR